VEYVKVCVESVKWQFAVTDKLISLDTYLILAVNAL